MTDDTLANSPDENLADEVRDGRDAERLLSDPLLIKTLDTMEEALTEAFKRAPIRDDEGLMGIKLQMNALHAFRKNLKTCVDTGKMATIQIKAQQEADEKGNAEA